MLEARWRASLTALLLLWATHQLTLYVPAGFSVLLLVPIAWALATAGVWYRSRGYAVVVLALLAMSFSFPLPVGHHDGAILLAWLVVVTAATEGRPQERALLLRICVSTVYGFVALTKLNPAWLAGDQLIYLAATRSQLAPFLELLHSPAGRVLAVGTIVAEATLAVGLWFRTTRAVTATVGILLHVALVWSANLGSWPGFATLVIVNFGLVAAYPAFWHDVPTRGWTKRPKNGDHSTQRAVVEAGVDDS